MDEKEKKILEAVLQQIKRLQSFKRTGKIELTIEINMTQGGIGSAFIQQRMKEEISFKPMI